MEIHEVVVMFTRAVAKYLLDRETEVQKKKGTKHKAGEGVEPGEDWVLPSAAAAAQQPGRAEASSKQELRDKRREEAAKAKEASLTAKKSASLLATATKHAPVVNSAVTRVQKAVSAAEKALARPPAPAA